MNNFAFKCVFGLLMIHHSGNVRLNVLHATCESQIEFKDFWGLGSF